MPVKNTRIPFLPLSQGGTQSWLRAALANDPETLYQVTAPLNFSPAWAAANQPVLQAARNRYNTLALAAFAGLMGAFLKMDLEERLSAISTPALVMVGEQGCAETAEVRPRDRRVHPRG